MDKRIKIALITTTIVAATAGAVFLVIRIRKNAKAKDTGSNQQSTSQTGTSKPEDSAANWHPDPLAKEISQNIEGVNIQTYPDTAAKVLMLSDDKLKRLYAYYNQYYAKDYPTLTQLFQAEWTDFNGLYKKVASRLVKLGLN